MALVKRNKNLPVFGSLFDELFDNEFLGFPGKMTQAVMPAVNVKETDTAFMLEVAVPGMKKDDFNIELDGNTLTISSESKIEKEETSEDEKYTRKEFSYSSFRRAFTLPEDELDTENISAGYEDGILKVTLPKLEEAKVAKSKRIEIA